jgi:hypothetical protein
MANNNNGGLTGLPLLGAGGFEQISVTSAAVVNLTVPVGAVACSISCYDVLAPALPIIQFNFGVNPTITSGNPIFDKMYFELTTESAMANIKFIGTNANVKLINVQYFY